MELHKKQKELIRLIETIPNIATMSLREIARKIGVDGSPQIVKYHLDILEQKGVIQKSFDSIKVIKKGKNTISNAIKDVIFAIPIVGSANCGPATIFAEQNIESYLRLSTSLLPRNKSNLFVIQASGDSMNSVNINNKNIEDGDYVLIDGGIKNFNDGNIVLSVIDGLANIKVLNKRDNLIILTSKSTKNYPPIYISEEDDFIINGKVIDVIKKL